MSDELPKWPEPPEHLGLANSIYWEAHYRALSTYWEARCRVAVEALKRIENLIGQLSPVHFADQEIGEQHAAKSHDIAWTTVRDIGPLPERK